MCLVVTSRAPTAYNFYHFSLPACDPPGLLGKRAERENGECPVVFKRWCSGIIDGEWDSPVSCWEALDSQMTPPSSSQQSLRQSEMDLTRSPGTSESTTELKEQQEVVTVIMSVNYISLKKGV